MTDEAGGSPQDKSPAMGVSETIQSLIVAFVIAMTARGFVLEGFVIPTGSMAPTLMGEHVRWDSPQTGWSYSIDAGGYVQMWGRSAKILADAQRAIQGTTNPDQRKRIGNEALRRAMISRWDPMFGLDRPVALSKVEPRQPRTRAGDRVLVLKTLYPFSEPDRFDVVVFKNPTDPVGATQNFIKRLVGLPEEQLVTVDGDIFTGPLGVAADELRVVRKPEFIQRAVWQPVYDSSYQPVNLSMWEQEQGVSWWGAPWIPRDGEGTWEIGTDRAWRSDSSTARSLEFNIDAWPITDFNMYNVYRGPDPSTQPFSRRPYAMSDVRILGTIEMDAASFKSTVLLMESRGMRFEWEVSSEGAALRMTRVSDGEEVASANSKFVPPNRPFEMDCWQVDQQMWLFVDEELLLTLPFNEWSPQERFLASFPGTSVGSYLRDPLLPRPEPPKLSWSFDGGPLTLRNVRVDRDLYYRPTRLDPVNQYKENGRPLVGLGFGTDLLNPAQIEADQFVLFGDNSAASRDGRIWGPPHPLAAAHTGDDSPFVVPRGLLVGKAFSVYFPAPLPWSDGGSNVVPDFGRLRFIR